MLKLIKLYLSKNLKRLRLSKGLTQAALAELMDISVISIQSWESGRNWPRLKSIQRLAEALGCTEADLMRDNNQKSAGEVADQKEVMKEALESLAYPELAQELHGLRAKVREYESGKLGDLIAGYRHAPPAIRLVALAFLTGNAVYAQALKIRFPGVWDLFEPLQEEQETLRPAQVSNAKK